MCLILGDVAVSSSCHVGPAPARDVDFDDCRCKCESAGLFVSLSSLLKEKHLHCNGPCRFLK